MQLTFKIAEISVNGTEAIKQLRLGAFSNSKERAKSVGLFTRNAFTLEERTSSFAYIFVYNAGRFAHFLINLKKKRKKCYSFSFNPRFSKIPAWRILQRAVTYIIRVYHILYVTRFTYNSFKNSQATLVQQYFNNIKFRQNFNQRVIMYPLER